MSEERGTVPMTVSIDASLMRRVFELVPVGVIVCDERGTILFANAALERTFGYPPAEVIGAPLELLLPRHAPDALGVRDTVRFGRDASDTALCVSELAGRRKDGSHLCV